MVWVTVDKEVKLQQIADPEFPGSDDRFNDGKSGPDGRYWAGTMDEAEAQPTGRLFAFGEQGDVAVLDDGYLVANGPAFSPDGETVYHTDSAKREVYAFALRSGRLEEKRLLIRFGENEGAPDGMTTDRDGNLWVAMWDGARVQVVSPEGARLHSISIPTKRPTSCVFAGSAGSDLFVTTARVGLRAEDHLAGALFHVGLK